jgi:hypothetical protein
LQRGRWRCGQQAYAACLWLASAGAAGASPVGETQVQLGQPAVGRCKAAFTHIMAGPARQPCRLAWAAETCVCGSHAMGTALFKKRWCCKVAAWCHPGSLGPGLGCAASPSDHGWVQCRSRPGNAAHVGFAVGQHHAGVGQVLCSMGQQVCQVYFHAPSLGQQHQPAAQGCVRWTALNDLKSVP